MSSADVVIAGGGVIGLSVAYHLLQRDPALSVVVVERADRPGTGSTAKATGGVRQQFSVPALVRLSQRSIPEYRAFEALTGVDVEFEDVGYLLVTTTPQGAERLRAAVAVQRACGVDVRELDRAGVADRWPHVKADDVVLGVFTPEDGHANPYAAVMGYVQAFRRLGGRVLLGEEVTGITLEGGRVTAVQTARRTIATGAVVNAAGVFAARVGALAGLDLPVRPFRRQVAVLTPVALGLDRVPFTMHTDSGWYLHRQADGALLVGGIDKDTHPGLEEVVDPDLTVRMIEMGLVRVPRLAEAALVRAYTGLRALTPDDLPILGPAPSVRGFFSACGLAGHGFMHAPGVGEALAEWILKGRVDLPELEVCLPDRFVRVS